MQALPTELAKIRGNEVCLFLPYYKRIKQNSAIEVEQVGSFSIDLSWRESYVGILLRRVSAVYRIDFHHKGLPGLCRKPHRHLPQKTALLYQAAA